VPLNNVFGDISKHYSYKIYLITVYIVIRKQHKQHVEKLMKISCLTISICWCLRSDATDIRVHLRRPSRDLSRDNPETDDATLLISSSTTEA